MKLADYNFKYNFRWMNTLWGVCNYKKKRITFSLRLACAEKEIIDYVIVHELAHIKHHHHGINFWRCVEKYIPNWKLLRKELNKHA
jgi:predicted metal-dependent hydrolase